MKLFNNTQSGRSMVEMLGVLAIIGVLSVGGIAGYSKAMNKYKINQTIDIISKTLIKFTELRTNPGNSDLWRTDTVAAGVLEGLTCDEDGVCQIPFGSISVYYNLIQPAINSSNNAEVCIDLLSHYWEKQSSESINRIFVRKVNGDITPLYSIDGSAGKINYTLSDIQSACSESCVSGSNCYPSIELR